MGCPEMDVMEVKQESSNEVQERPPDNIPLSPSVEKDAVEEEELPPTEVVTVYFEDETVQETAECLTSDPLAFDFGNEDAFMSIKEEPVDELPQSLRFELECENDHTIIKTENIEEEFEFNNGSDSYWSRAVTENANCDNNYANSFRLQNVATSEDSSKTSSVDVSTFKDPSKVSDESPETPVAAVHRGANVRMSIRLRKKQDHFISEEKKSRGIWHSAAVLKQERLQLSISKNGCNQVLNPFMVQIPVLGFKKYKRGGVSRHVACDYCGKLFGGVTSLWGHLSTCQQRPRYRQRNNPAPLTVPKKTTAKKAIQKAAQNVINNGPLNRSVSVKRNKKTQLNMKSAPVASSNNEKYKCKVCEKPFLTQSGLHKHMKKHPNCKIFQCQTCQSSFNYRQNLRRHCLTQGHEALMYPCSVCDKQFYCLFDSELHQARHDQHPPECKYCCSTCDETFDSALKLQRHSARFHLPVEDNNRIPDEPKNCTCSVCGNQYKSIRRLHHHMQWHSNSKYNMCPVCKKKFVSRGELQRHKLVHRKENKFCCDMCDKVFLSRKNLNQHKLRHKDSSSSTCSHCHQTFSKPAALWEHYTYCGARMANSYGVTKDSKKTSKLNMKYTQRNSKIMAGGKERMQKFQTTKNIGSQHALISLNKKYKCELCNKSVASQHSLVRHQTIHYGQLDASNPNGVLCVICGCKFSSNITLLRHQRFHKVGNRFQCLMCKKNFETARNLKIHMHSHRMDSETLNKCDECGKCFSSEMHLKYHLRTHIGYSCPKCSKSFENRFGLAGHANFCPSRHSVVSQIASLKKKTSRKKINIKPSTLRSQNPQKEFINNAPESRKVYTSSEPQTSLIYPCNTCKKKFSSTLLLKYHIRQHAGEIALTCNNCMKTFETPFSWKGHLSHCPVRRLVMAGLLSRKDDTLQCHVCGKITSTITNYVSHMRTHADNEPSLCGVCGASFETKLALRTHVHRCRKGFVTTSGFSCKHCSENFINRGALLKHYATCGNPSLNQLKKSKNSVKKLKRINTGQMKKSRRNSETSVTKNSQSVVYSQGETGLAEEEEENLIKQHFYVLEHGANGPEKWGCKVCKKVLTCKSNLKFHCYIHTGNSPFQCGICGKRMVTRGALNQHLRNIHKVPQKKLNDTQIAFEPEMVKPVSPAKTSLSVDNLSNVTIACKKVFECDICSRTFDIVSALRKHKEAHSRLLRCSACGGSYRTLREFREHICTDNFIQLCEHCGMQFFNDSSFSSHICPENTGQ